MAIIGSFTKSELGHYSGTLSTLTVTARLRITPNERKNGPTSPDYRVYSGRAELGAAWEKVTDDGRAYLSIALDDPSFAAPINAALVEDDTDNGAYNLVWNRAKPR